MNYFRQYRPAKHSMLPPGVLNLIIINVIMFAAKMFGETQGIDMDLRLGLHHPFASDFSWYQYLTSIFMHGDGSHLLFNMLGVWMFGYLLENAYGTKRFVIFYLICGMGAAFIYQIWTSFSHVNLLHGLGATGGFFQLLLDYPPNGLLIGASGSVFGLLMGSALVFPNTEMPYLGFMGIPIKLKWIAIIYGGGELYRSWHQNPADHIAHFAHIGGMIFGFILVKIYSRNKTHFY